MSASERAALAQLDMLKALSGARSRLILSYALADETGRALREGAAVENHEVRSWLKREEE